MRRGFPGRVNPQSPRPRGVPRRSGTSRHRPHRPSAERRGRSLAVRSAGREKVPDRAMHATRWRAANHPPITPGRRKNITPSPRSDRFVAHFRGEGRKKRPFWGEEKEAGEGQKALGSREWLKKGEKSFACKWLTDREKKKSQKKVSKKVAKRFGGE